MTLFYQLLTRVKNQLIVNIGLEREWIGEEVKLKVLLLLLLFGILGGNKLE